MENNKYHLDQADDGRWLIKNHSESFTAGYDKEKVIDLIERLNDSYRPNVIQGDPNQIYVCWNDHDKGENCDYELEIDNL